MSNPPHIDPERLAALLEGRLNEADAAALRAQLASADDDTLGAYADAIAIAGEGRVSRPTIIQTRPRRWRRWIPVPLALVAAVVLAVVFVRPRNSADVYQPLAYARAVPRQARVPESPVWSATRGATSSISDRSRAVRIGALLTDIEFGIMHGEPTSSMVDAVTTLLQDIPGGGSYAAPLRAYAEAPNDPALSGDRRREVGRQILGFVDRPYANAGAWLEAARLASGGGDVEFFDRVAPDALTSIAEDTRLDAPTRAAIAEVIASAQARPVDVAAMRAESEDALRLLTI